MHRTNGGKGIRYNGRVVDKRYKVPVGVSDIVVQGEVAETLLVDLQVGLRLA